MKQPTTVIECLPQLRLFALVMCPDRTAADKAVGECLARAQKRRFGIPDPDRIFLTLLTDLAAAIRQGRQVRVPDDGHFKQRTMQILRQLPPHHRDVLIAVTLFNLRYWEAADVCGCPVGTIKSRLSRAKAAFTAALEIGSNGKAVSHRSLPSHAGLN
jgi:DNA-directed RNA polymerase specialized sigma24 family protein